MWNYMCIGWLINWSDSTKMHGATIRFILPKCLDKCQYWIESRDDCFLPLCGQAAITQNQCMPVLHAIQRGWEGVKRILVAKGCTGGVRIMTEGWESYRVAISKSPSKKRSWNKRRFIQQQWTHATLMQDSCDDSPTVFDCNTLRSLVR